MINTLKRCTIYLAWELSYLAPIFFYKRLKRHKHVIESLINRKLCIFELSQIITSNKIWHGIGNKIIDNDYIKKNTFFKSHLKQNTLYVSTHLAQNHLLYKIFIAFQFDVVYIRSKSSKGYDSKANHHFYDREYIYKHPKQITDVIKALRSSSRVYYAADGSLAKNKLYLNNDIYTMYSNLLPLQAIKFNKNIAFVNCIVDKTGIITVSTIEYDYKTEFDTWFKENYIKVINDNPHTFNPYRIKVSNND